MVVALGQAGDDDGADEAVGDVEGEAAAVGGVVGEREAVAGFEGLVVELKLAADGVGAAREAANGVALAANPVGLAGRGAGRGAGEEDVVGEFDLGCAAGVASEEGFAEDGCRAARRCRCVKVGKRRRASCCARMARSCAGSWASLWCSWCVGLRGCDEVDDSQC